MPLPEFDDEKKTTITLEGLPGISPKELAMLISKNNIVFKSHSDFILVLQAAMAQVGNDPSVAFRVSNFMQGLAERSRAYASTEVENLVKLAEELDQMGEPEAAAEVSKLVAELSPDDLSEMKSNVDKINDDLQVALKTVQKSNDSVEQEEVFAKLSPKFMAKLANMADKLDSIGAYEQADMIDAFLEKHAGEVLPDVVDWKENKEKPDPYDAERHHSLTIREPKRDQERHDLEGRKEYHVKEYSTQQGESKKEAALSTRYSPDMTGVMLQRVGDDLWQDPITGKVYDFANGYTDNEGNFHPGGSIAAQTPDSSGYEIPHRIFDSRESVINRINN